MDAASRGAIDAMTLVLGIIASLMAVLSVLAMVNGVLAFLGTLVGKRYSQYNTNFIFTIFFKGSQGIANGAYN